jgi:hypothetical protein
MSFRSIAVIALAVTAVLHTPALAQEAKRPDKVSFYFAAHEDDWQLFMNRRHLGRGQWRGQDRVRACHGR